MFKCRDRCARYRYARAGLTGIFLALATISIPVNAAASNADEIQNQINAFLHSINADSPDSISVSINTPTAHMPACHDPQPFLPHRGGRTTGRLTVGIHCSDGQPKTRYIQADVHVTGRYFVAAHDIDSRHIISVDDLASRHGDITRKADRLARNEKEIVGQQARRRIAEDTPIVANMLTPPDVITRGEKVKIISKGPGFIVSTHGKALGNAASGESLRVRTENGTVVTGMPNRAGVVTVKP